MQRSFPMDPSNCGIPGNEQAADQLAKCGIKKSNHQPASITRKRPPLSKQR